ncbi:MAG: class II aldolase/adducin family protein [Thermoanaerobaculales bacterium]|nr:class II aldolase/adducin family protein [Thermoanaerobaculales bacterium]
MSEIDRERERELRHAIVEVGRWMWERNHIAGTDGNISARLDQDHLLTTPSGIAKGRMNTSDLVITDLSGRVMEGNGRPSSELKVHLATYRLRSDVGSVVHAHPRTAVALTLAGVSLAPVVIPETVLTLGIIAAADYETPGTEALVSVMEESLLRHDAIIMDRHGSITLGTDPYHAYNRLESLEHAAQILFMARALGNVEPLPETEVAHLFELAGHTDQNGE